MFTLDQIHRAFNTVRNGADFPRFVQDLKTLGVIYYETYVSDGHTLYYGVGDYMIHSEPKYPIQKVSPNSSKQLLKQALSNHQGGLTDYPTFCKLAAEAGVKTWTTHIVDLTVTYKDATGKALLVEPIPIP